MVCRSSLQYGITTSCIWCQRITSCITSFSYYGTSTSRWSIGKLSYTDNFGTLQNLILICSMFFPIIYKMFTNQKIYLMSWLHWEISAGLAQIFPCSSFKLLFSFPYVVNLAEISARVKIYPCSQPLTPGKRKIDCFRQLELERWQDFMLFLWVLNCMLPNINVKFIACRYFHSFLGAGHRYCYSSSGDLKVEENY
jgi:hypothetical protein